MESVHTALPNRQTQPALLDGRLSPDLQLGLAQRGWVSLACTHISRHKGIRQPPRMVARLLGHC